MKYLIYLLFATSCLAYCPCIDEDDVELWSGTLGDYARDHEAGKCIEWEAQARKHDDKTSKREKRRIYIFHYWTEPKDGRTMIMYVSRKRNDDEIAEILKRYFGGNTPGFRFYKGR